MQMIKDDPKLECSLRTLSVAFDRHPTFFSLTIEMLAHVAEIYWDKDELGTLSIHSSDSMNRYLPPRIKNLIMAKTGKTNEALRAINGLTTVLHLLLSCSKLKHLELGYNYEYLLIALNSIIRTDPLKLRRLVRLSLGPQTNSWHPLLLVGGLLQLPLLQEAYLGRVKDYVHSDSEDCLVLIPFNWPSRNPSFLKKLHLHEAHTTPGNICALLSQCQHLTSLNLDLSLELWRTDSVILILLFAFFPAPWRPPYVLLLSLIKRAKQHVLSIMLQEAHS